MFVTPAVLVLLTCVCFSLASMVKLGSTTRKSNVREVIPYLQSELASCSSAQQHILSFLHGKGIPVGLGPASLRRTKGSAESLRSRITVSTSDKGVECRIALGKAPPGAKCVAPCGCTGSQKWVQFSELNRLRRKDPSQWTVCRTCQQKFDYTVFESYGGLPGNIVGYVLDHKPMLRASVVAVGVLVMYLMNAPLWLCRVLTSRLMWQQFPQWSKLTHLPLALKFWGLKLLAQFAGDKYVQWERDVVLAYLTDMETKLIEDNLPAEPLP